jgi:hypothetical protein
MTGCAAHPRGLLIDIIQPIMSAHRRLLGIPAVILARRVNSNLLAPAVLLWMILQVHQDAAVCSGYSMVPDPPHELIICIPPPASASQALKQALDCVVLPRWPPAPLLLQQHLTIYAMPVVPMPQVTSGSTAGCTCC